MRVMIRRVLIGACADDLGHMSQFIAHKADILQALF